MKSTRLKSTMTADFSELFTAARRDFAKLRRGGQVHFADGFHDGAFAVLPLIDG